MKHTLLTSAILLFLLCSCNSDKAGRQEKIDISTVAMSDTVWVCTSSGAKRFHASDTCGGILSCGETILQVTRDEAEHSRRTYCHKCYTNNQ